MGNDTSIGNVRRRYRMTLTGAVSAMALFTLVVLTTRTASPGSSAPLVAIAVSAATATSGSGVLFVDDDAAANGDGLTWDTAYRFLQDALAFASDPANGVAEIRVAQGTYKPDRDEANPNGDGDREATFQLIDNLTLAGGYAGIAAEDPDARDVDNQQSILDGDLLDNDLQPFFYNYEENTFNILTAHGTLGGVVSGFTVTGGNSVESESPGAGLSVIDAIDCVVENCLFIENGEWPTFWVSNSTVAACRCRFVGNLDQVAYITDGSTAEFVDCEFDGRQQHDHRSVTNFQATTTMIGCRVTGDHTIKSQVGGVFNQNGQMTLINCDLHNNVAGVGVFSNTWNGTDEIGMATLINCTIANNEGTHDLIGGAGIYNGIAGNGDGMAILTIDNCTIWGNFSAVDGAHNEGAQITNLSDLTVNYSNVEGLTGDFGGAGNIGADPTFVAENSRRVLPGSPSNDAGSNNSVPEEIIFDLDGTPRFADDAEARDMGRGRPPIVDMGPYEFEFRDCNGNGVSDSADIADGTVGDCNLNGIPDVCDIASGESSDTDGDGVPDECQDCNGNFRHDGNDIADGFSHDCNQNGVPDECEIDCNGNGIPDECDIASGASIDCDDNGVPDECDNSALFSAESEVFTPLDSDFDYTWVVESPPVASSDVTIEFVAVGELESFNSFVGLSINDVQFPARFRDGAQDCPKEPDVDALVFAAGDFNTLFANQDLTIELSPFNVDAEVCAQETFIAVSIEYLTPSFGADSCPLGDLDSDGDVDGSDLIILLGAWGACDDCDDCTADLDGDCDVDGADLILLLGNWG